MPGFLVPGTLRRGGLAGAECRLRRPLNGSFNVEMQPVAPSPVARRHRREPPSGAASQAIESFIETWNRHEARPFRWTYDGLPLVTMTASMKPTEIARSKLVTLLEQNAITAGMSVRIYGDQLILGREYVQSAGAKPETVESVRLTRLTSSTYGLSVRRHYGRWERTPFSGTLKEMVEAIHTYMQHLVAEW